MLLETGDKILAHAYDRDSLFACGMDEAQLKAWAKEKNGTMIQVQTQSNSVSFKRPIYCPMHDAFLGTIAVSTPKWPRLVVTGHTS